MAIQIFFLHAPLASVGPTAVHTGGMLAGFYLTACCHPIFGPCVRPFRKTGSNFFILNILFLGGSDIVIQTYGLKDKDTPFLLRPSPLGLWAPFFFFFQNWVSAIICKTATWSVHTFCKEEVSASSDSSFGCKALERAEWDVDSPQLMLLYMSLLAVVCCPPQLAFGYPESLKLPMSFNGQERK